MNVFTLISLLFFPSFPLSLFPSLSGNNQLKFVPGPECLSTLCGLKNLDLSNNQLTALGSDGGIGTLTNLEVLNLSGNVLESLPEDLGCIGSSLLTLNLSNNQLRWLPSTIDQLIGLRFLDISQNQLTTIPRNMNGLKQLVEIHGSRNHLAMIPDSFGSLISLEIISFQHNNLRTLPETVGLLTRLQHINLQNNRLKDLPREMGSWILLEQLNVTSNDIISLPKSCGHCHLLKKLELGYNKIEYIPDTVSTLTHLEIFNVNSNLLNRLTSGIGKCHNLLELDLGSNTNLKCLPREIGNCGKLKKLNISSCGMSKLPNDLVRCTALQSLWLRHNRLEALPIELVEQIPTLAEFDVMNNPLRKLPEKWSGLKRSSVSGTGYTSRDASEYIARQSRVHPVAVLVWERMMAEHPNWTSPVVEGKGGEGGGEKDVNQTAKKAKKTNDELNDPDTIVIHTAGAMKSDGTSLYKLPITITEFMAELKQELGVRWDEHAYETSIRFFKQARNLCGRGKYYLRILDKLNLCIDSFSFFGFFFLFFFFLNIPSTMVSPQAPRYDQLDVDDFENENYAREMAHRKTEDKVIWSHRDSVRAIELRQQAYESSLDSLGLKILNRRLRRDYAERKKRMKYKEKEYLLERMDEEWDKQELQAALIQKRKDEQALMEQTVVKAKMDEKMRVWRLKNPIQTKRHKGFVLSVNDVVEEEEENGFLLGQEERKEEDEEGNGDHWYEDDVSDTSSYLAVQVPQQREADEYRYHEEGCSTRGSTRDYNYQGKMDGMGTQTNVTAGNVGFRNVESADSTLFDDYDLELMENNFKK